MTKKTLLLFCFLIVKLYGQNTGNPRTYLYEIVGVMEYTTQCFNKVTSASNRIEANLWIDSLKQSTVFCSDFLKKAKEFDKNIVLKSPAIEYINHLSSISKKELPAYFQFFFNSKYTQQDMLNATRLEPIIFDQTNKLYEAAYLKIDEYKQKYYIVFPSDLQLQYIEKNEFMDVLAYCRYIEDIVKLPEQLWELAIDENDKTYSLLWADSLNAVSKRVLGSLEKLEPYKGDACYKLAAINYIQNYIDISSKELPEFIELVFIRNRTTEVQDRINALIPLLDDKRISLSDRFIRTKTTITARQGVYIEWYPNRPWPEIPNFEYVEKTSFTSASEYDEYMMQIVFTVCDAWWHALQMDLGAKALPWNDSLRIQSDRVLESLKKMGPYENSDEYRLAAIAYVQWVGNASKAEIPEYIQLDLINEKTQKEKERFEVIRPVVEQNTYDVFDELRKKQIDFAVKYQFQVKF